jgi:hypothetical protein
VNPVKYCRAVGPDDVTDDREYQNGRRRHSHTQVHSLTDSAGSVGILRCSSWPRPRNRYNLGDFFPQLEQHPQRELAERYLPADRAGEGLRLNLTVGAGNRPKRASSCLM